MKGKKKHTATICALIGIIAVISVPLLLNYCLPGKDLIFQLTRIEGVKDSLLAGQFPVRMRPGWLHASGYATPFFYGDTFLVIPAALRMMGFSMHTAYNLFLLLINIATALIAYVCFNRIFGKRTIGLVGSMLYTWAPYRINDLYGRAALGDVMAITFFPILLLGFYLIYTDDITGKEYKNRWILPAIGFSGILQSYTLSFEMMSVIMIILCLIFWRRTFRRQTFAVLCKTVLATVLFNAWFLVPFVDYYLNGDFVIKYISEQPIQNRGVYFLHYFFTFFRNGTSSQFNQMGMNHTEPLGIGFAVTCAVLLYVWQRFVGRYHGKEDEWGIAAVGKTMAVIGCVVMVMSTNSFPWEALKDVNQLCAILISRLQFPLRLPMISALCFIFVACVAIRQTEKWESKEVSCSVLLTVTIIAFVTTQFLIGDMLSTMQPMWLSDAENVEDIVAEGEELGLYDTVPPFLTENGTGQGSYVDALLTYDRGYTYFVSPWYWRVAEGISAISSIGIVTVWIWRKRRVA